MTCCTYQLRVAAKFMYPQEYCVVSCCKQLMMSQLQGIWDVRVPLPDYSHSIFGQG
jgi:hypothetical protein